MKIGAVILCGGKSSRMGTDKALLRLGGETFFDRIVHQLFEFDEILLSTNTRKQNPPFSYPNVVDIYPGCGPMAGLHAALSFCQSDALLAVSCDMPLFHSDLARFLCNAMGPDVDGVVPVSTDGRLHPLCAIYQKNLACKFQCELESGNYKLQNVLRTSKIRSVHVDGQLELRLQNINTPEEYRKCCEVWQIRNLSCCCFMEGDIQNGTL